MQSRLFSGEISMLQLRNKNTVVFVSLFNDLFSAKRGNFLINWTEYALKIIYSMMQLKGINSLFSNSIISGKTPENCRFLF